MPYRSQAHRIGSSRKSLGIFMGSVGLALVIAGCGTTAATGSTGSYGGGGNTSASPSPTASTVKGTNVTNSIRVGSATVRGKTENVLQDSKGYTLYYFTKDSPGVSHCNGSCSALWHPLLGASTNVTGSAAVTGTVSVVSDSHGNQVEYNGHPLYLYSGDSKAGQANGQGLLGTWWVATPSLATGSATSTSASNGSSTSPTSSSSAGGSGWGG